MNTTVGIILILMLSQLVAWLPHRKIIGYFDDSRYFLDPDRVNAKIIWFAEGYVEYKFSNYLLPGQHLEEIETPWRLDQRLQDIIILAFDIYFELNGV